MTLPKIELAIGSPGWDWSASVEGLLGALIGGLFALVATLIAAALSDRQAKRHRRAVVIGGVRAIWAEMKVNFERYENELANTLRNLADDDYLTINWPLQSEYFSVYAASAGLLGELDDDVLAFDIVKTVTTAKGLIDSLRLNLEFVEALAEMKSRARAGQGGVDLELLIVDREAQLVGYAASIKNIDPILTEAMANLGPRINALS